ncbi:MAG: AAA family ATPase [Planctomycetes bacterium]|nr:AAA family ATPase [Planctomycetota bacterium]MCC7171159.1 AAA family ATPase [Planctomycetota bacterium]
MSGKIAFIGTHGVGKTVLTFTVAARLRAAGVDADVAVEHSRRSPFPINEGTTLESQLWILSTQWQEELEARRRTELVICDRAVIDNYAYLVRAFGEQPWLRAFLEHWSRTYDALFWVPIVDDEVTKDRMRSTSRRFQRDIHERVGQLVESFGLSDRVTALPQRRDEQMPLVLDTLRTRRLLPPKQGALFDGLDGAR